MFSFLYFFYYFLLFSSFLDDSEDCDYTILSGVNVLLSILEPAPSRLSMAPGINNLNMMNDYYNDYSLTDEQEREVQNRYQNVIDVTLNCMAKRIESLTNMLKRPPSRNFRRCPANMPNGIEFKSLGASRLNICKLFTEILKHKNAKMNQIFIKNGVLKTMVDLFFEYRVVFFKCQIQGRCLIWGRKRSF